MNSLLQDLRFATRSLLRSPGFALVAVLTLALGIGATTAIFSVVHGVLLRPLPFPEPERIVHLWQVNDNGGHTNVSDPNFADLAEQSRSFRALAQLASGEASVTGGSEPVRVAVTAVSRGFFDVLGVRPVLGRAFLPEEQREGGAPAVIVSHAFWQRHLGADPELASHALTFENRTHAVVGVMPPGLSLPRQTELWIPRELVAPSASRKAQNWQVVARLADGVSLAAARAEVSSIARRLKQLYGEDTWMADAALVPLRDQLVGRVRPALLVLLGSAGFLLLIACANVGNLLLARIAGRGRELRIRLALGAGRGRLVQQFLVESLVLALAGGALGVVLAVWGVELLLRLEPGGLPRLDEIRVDGVVLAFAVAASALTAGALGLGAALRGSRDDRSGTLLERERSETGSIAGQRARSLLVVAQVALTLVLLVGAGLLGRSFQRLLAVDPGFRTGGAVVVGLTLPSIQEGADPARQTALLDELHRRLRALPGVAAVGGINSFPLEGGYSNGTFLILARPDEVQGYEDFGRLARDPSRSGYAEYRVAGEGYFRAMGIPLVRGRLFEQRDAPDAPHAALISESLARTRWPGEDPIGKLIQFGNMDGDVRAMTIVGIVGDVRDAGLDAAPSATIYANYRQRPNRANRFHLVVQGAAAPEATAAAARRVLRELAPEAPPNIRTLEEVFAASLADRRFSLLLLGVFGVTALVLALMGLYGVVSYLVAQRTREIGIRVALGARPADVSRLVVRRGALLAGAGIVLGLFGSLGLTRFLGGLLFSVSATDPAAYALVTLLLAAVALLASYLPARRAARVDPLVALRAE